MVESTKMVESTILHPIIDLIDLNIDLSPDNIINTFYNGIGQKRISKTKRENGGKIIQELLEDNFAKEDILFAVEWVPKNVKEKLYDFSIIKHTIGQALSARDADAIAIQNTQEEETKVRVAEEEQKRLDAKIEKIRKEMSKEKLAELREEAFKEIRNTDGIKEQFISEPLITAKENEILNR